MVACANAGPAPALGRRDAGKVVCRECLTPETRGLLARLERIDEGHFGYLEQLELTIGYFPLCTECLYENTGVDVRREPTED